MRRIFFILSLVLTFSFTVFAQENCNDGIDNDGDGLIDCNDPDCQFPPTEEEGCNCEDGIDNDGDGKIDVFDPKCAAFYGLTFVGDDTDCAITPPAMGDVFATIGNNTAVSGQNTVDTQSKMAIGDVDGDGIPDVVATSKWNQTMRLIATTDDQDDGSDAGDVKASWKTTDPSAGDILKAGGSTFFFDLETLIADIDRDGTAELFATVYQRKNSNKQILAYYIGRWDYDGTKDLVNTWAVNLGPSRPGIPGIADFDGDGKGEIYLKNHIYDAHTGALLASAGGDWNTEVNAAPAAVDMTGDGRLELVSGKNIYSVGGSPVSSISLLQDMNSLGLAQYFPKVLNDVFEYGITNFSSTSVADFDDDGNIDVFISGAVGSTAGHTAIFYWNVAKGTVNTFLPTHPDTGSPPSVVTYPNGWPWGTGRVNLGELDGDGILEANFIAGNQLYALEEGPGGTLVDLWGGPKTLNDFRSGVVATTVYDFDNDGTFELVYRDTQVLSIIDGATGSTTLWSTSCQSHTMTEGPIIADINGDGGTDICVPCFTGPGLFKIDGGLSQQALGEIRVFFSGDNSWLPTRRVYNQPGYFVVNINDDLTLPFPQLGQTLIFGNDACANGLPGPQQPLNTFLNQVPNLGANGCPVYPGPDIAFVGNDPTLQPGDSGYVDPGDPNYFPSVEVIPPICGDLAIVVNFNIINDGLRAITSDIPTSFWDGDPSVDPTATLLHTEVLPVTNFGIGDTLSYSGVTFNSTGKAFILYVVLNDDGTQVPPFPIGGPIEECKVGNNVVAFPITPEPFTVQLEIIQDNNKCDDAAPDNGELRAIVFEGGVEAPDLSKYGFQWYAGPDTTAAVVPDPLGSLDRLTGMAEGSYTVVVTNLDKGCMSLPIDTTLTRIGVDPDINIIENSPQSQCSPFNGELEVQIVGGNAGFTFEWFRGAAFVPMGVTSAVISNLEKDDYVVRVTKDGCTKTAARSLSGPIFPDGVATTLSHVVDCANLNSGVIDADASVGGVIQDPAGFDFTWYHWDNATSTLGAPIASSFGTGKTRTGLPIGWYAVIVKNTATNCESFPPVPTEVLDQTQFPTVIVSELEPNSSCDPLSPNGQLQVAIDLGGIPQDPALYTIEWFEGDNTSPVNQIFTTAGVNGEVVTNVGLLATPYTVSVSSALNCATTDTLSVSQNIITPVISAVAINNSICNPALASGNPFNGSANSSVTFNGIPVTPAELAANYSFVWYDGADISSDPIIAGETNSSLLNLDAGFYSVTVSLDTVGCTSLPITVEVTDIPTLPTILISELPETTCSGTPNGSLTAAVDVGGVPTITGYTFEWYIGIGIGGGPVAVISGTEGENALQLDGNQNYTARVINDATGCEDQLTFYLNDNSVTPVGSAVMAPNSVCDPLLTNPAVQFNGSVTATIELNTVPVVDYSPYEFTWYSGGSVVDPIIPGQLTRVLPNVQEGFYTFTAFDLTLGCSSIPVTIEVTSNLVFPVITSTATPSTNCIPDTDPNGQIVADTWVDINGNAIRDVGVEDLPGLFTYQWHTGVDTSTPIVGETNPTLSTVQGGAGRNYTIEVLHLASGCAQTYTVLLNDASELPIVSLVTTPNIGCTPGLYTGTVTATIMYKGVDVTASPDYSFAWSGPNAYSSTAAVSIAAVESGDFTLTVTNNVLSCVSLPVTATVLDNPAVITITDTNTPSTNCIPDTDPNGQIVADTWVDINGNAIRDVGVEDLPGLFTYQWHTGVDTSTPIVGETNPTLSTVQGGAGRNYTIEVLHLASGCAQTYTVLLNDASELPIVSLVTTPNIGCTPGLYTGTVTATIMYKGVDVTASPDYSFAWSGPNAYSSTAAVSIAAVESGDFTLTVTNNVLSCVSLPVTATVLDNPAVITITDTNTPSTNCIPDTDPNGQIVADTWVDINGNAIRDVGVEDLPGLFTYQWHTGVDTSTPIVGETNPTLSTVQGGAGRNYTIEVLHLASGCTQTYTVLLNDASELPIVSLVTTPNIGCTPGLYTGTVTATIMYKGVDVTASPDYSFAWSGPNAYSSTAAVSIAAVESGDFTLTVTNNVLSCVSLPVTATVLDNPAVITITDTNTPSTNCIPDTDPNGQIVADTWVDINGNAIRDVGVEDLPGLFTYQWHTGVDTSTPIVGETNPTLSTVQGGAGRNYTIEVLHLASGCAQTYTVLLNDASELPIVSLVTTPNIGCTPGLYTGTVTATIMYKGVDVTASPDYSFAWSGPNAYSSTAAVSIAAVESGDFTLTVTNNVLSCVSLPVTATVLDNPAVITITDTNTPSTNCIPDTDPNGQIVADTWVDINGNAIRDVGVEDLPGLFTYQWHTGVDTSTPIVGETNPTLSTVQGGAGRNYTIEVLHLASGCTQTYTVLLNDASELPIVSLVTTPNIGCTPGLYTGTVTATIMYKGVDVTASPDYSFAWSGPNAYSSTAAVSIAAVESGDFTLTVTNNVLSCVSLPVTATVLDNPAVITITDTNTPSTNCIPDTDPNGQIVADTWVDINGNAIRDVGVEDLPGLFTYQWHTGVDTSTPIVGETNPTLSTVQGGAGRNYTIEVLHLASGCAQTYTVLLNDASELPIVSLVTTPNIGCTPGLYTGTVTATIMYKGVDVTASPDYSFAWSGPNAYSSTAAVSIAAVESGDFTLTVTNNVLSCVSLPVTATVLDNPAVITITDTNTPSTNCIPDTDPNGQIVADTWVDINGNAIRDVGVEDLPGLFTYQWHTGVDTSTPIVGETNPTLSTVQGGAGRNYTIEVLHLASGCAQTYTVLLNDASELPIVSLTPTDNKGCTAANYSGTVSATVMYKGVDVTASGDYSFAWTSSDGGFVSVDAANIVGLKGSETYTLTATNTVLGCIALDVTTTVDDSPDLIVIFFNNTRNNSCSATGNGSLLAGVDTNSNGIYDPGVDDNLANLGDYIFTWHVGNTTSGVLPASIPAVNNIDQLDGNEFYTLEVERISTGCINTHTEWVQKAVILPQINLAVTSYTNCMTDVVVQAQIANLADFFPDNDPDTDFTYTWYRGSDVATGTLLPAAGTVPNPSGQTLTTLDGVTELPADDYTVVVAHNISTCIAPEKSSRILEPPVLFDINPVLDMAASNCGLLDGIAYVTVSANGSGYVLPAGPYTYDWYLGAPTNTAPVRNFDYVGPLGTDYNQVDNVTSASFFTDPIITFGGLAVEIDPVDDIGGTQDPNAVLSGVQDGLYTVVVTDANGCREYITFQIPFAQAQQSNIVTVTPDTDCTADNSSINVVVVPDIADVTNPLATDYDIYLFAGSNPTLPAPPAVPNPIDYLETQAGLIGGNTFPTIAGTMSPGVYTIVSQGQAGSRCFSIPTVVTIEEWANDPIVNLSGNINPNTSCDLPATPDGSLVLDIQHHPDEEFDLAAVPPITETTYEILAVPADASYANVAVGPGLAVGLHNVTGLGPTDYTITVTSSRGCSTIRTYSIPDEPFITEVTSFVVTNTTTCSPLNGSIEVSAINQIGNVAALSRSDFLFTWYYDINGNGVFDDLSLYNEAGEEINGNPDKGEVYDINNAGFSGPGIYWLEISALPAAGAGLDCPSAPIQFEIIDDSVNPIFTYDVTANTSCDPAGADGSFFIDPDRNSPDPLAPIFGGWTIDITSVPVGSTLPLGPNALALETDVFTATGLLHGQYDFTVIDDATGCSITTGSLNIPENAVPPILNNIVFTVLDQFECNPAGSITITQFETIVSGTPGPPVTAPTTAVDALMSNYEFTWYYDANGNAILDDVATRTNVPGGGATNGDIYQDPDAGFAGAGIYWVEITKVAGSGGIGCTSSPYQFEIIDDSVNPIFTYDVTANTSCDPAGADGSFFIDPDRNSPDPLAPIFGGWTIDITSVPVGSTLPLGPNALALETDVFTATGLLHGQYDFTVIDDATGCSITTGSLNIPENAVPPILNNIVFTVVDQFECNPAGSITITQFETIVSGTPGPPVTAPTTAVDALMSNYEFTWYYDANGNAILDDAATRTNVPGGGATNGDIYQDPDAGFAGAGIYWVEITKVAGSGGIGCTSSPYQFEIIDDSVNPIFTYDVTANTSCDPAGADGSFFIDPDRNSPDPLAPIFGGWTIDITSVPVGSTLPLGPNALALETDVFTATGLLHGQYDFTVIDDATGCSITTGSLNIPENAVPPILNNIVFTVVDQFECNPAGSITITQFETIVSGTPGPPVTAPTTAVDALMSNYEFTWYYDANGNAILDDAATRTNVPGGGATNGDIYQDPDAGFAGAGIYWVEITKVAGSGGIGCTSSPYQFEIIDDSVNPIFTYDVTANTSCDPAGADGSFFIDPDRNSPDPLAPIFGGWTIDITSVPVGSTLPLGPNALALETDVFTATGLLHGQYDFTVIDDATGCSITTGSLNIPENAVPPILNNIVFTVVDQFECNPAGSITITQFETIVSGTPGPPVTAPTTAVDALMSNYEFTWYYDANGNAILDDVATRTNVPGGGATNGDIYQDPDAGFAGAGIYWVEITKVAGSGGIGCTSSPYQFEIIDDSVNPIFTYDVTANTSCDPAGADGSFFIDPDRNSPDPLAPIFGGWTIDITSVPVGSTLPLGPNALALETDVFTATGLLHGQYDFTVIDDATGCSITTGSLNIPENAVPPILNNIVFTVVDQFECNPAGSITITQFETIVSGTPGPPVTAPTTAVDALMSNYEFTWYYDANGNAILDDVATRTNVPGGGATNGDIYQDPDAGFAGAGIYWVEITKVAGSGGIGCTSSPYQFEIIDDSVNPIFTYDVTANTSCDPAGADGSFFIDPDRNSPDPLAPIFGGWTIDITSVPVGSTLPLGPNALALETDVFTATGLLHGQYDFTVIDDATGCSITTGSLNIPENAVPPILNNIVFTVVDQFECNPAGSITITQFETIVSGTPGPPVTAPTTAVDALMSNYEFTWYYDANGNAILDDVATRTNVPGGGATNGDIYQDPDAGFAGAGIYWVEITKVAGSGGIGCTSSPYQFEIIDDSVDPIFTYDVTANTSCDPAGTDGSVTITPNANGSVVALTTWTYTFVGPTPIAPITNSLVSTQVTDLLPGDYSFTILHDNSNCGTTGQFNIPDNPIAPLVLDPDPIIIHQLTCNIGGSITIGSVATIESISLNSVFDVNLNNYEFVWYVGDDFSTAVQLYTDIGLSGTAGHIYDITDPGFIGAGTYWLEVRKITANPGEGGLGCTSSPYKYIIEDQSTDPLITFTQTSNTACNLTMANGSLTAAASTNGVSVPAIISVFTWYNGPSSLSPPFVDGVDGTIYRAIPGEETLRDVTPGIYTVNIMDGNTGCSIEASFEVEDQPLIPDLNLDNAVTVDQTVCLPSGSITVLGTDIIVGGVPLNAGDELDFIFTWRLGSPTAAPLDSANAGVSTGLPIQGPRIDSTNYLTMGAGTYYVTIASKIGIGAGCTGPPVSKVINDLSVDPAMSFVTAANSSCDITTPNGAIGVVAQEADGSTDTYTFAWSYTGTGVMPPQVDIGATSNILNAPDGDYSVTVTNTITGCSFTQGRALILDQTMSIPNDIAVIKTDPLDCNPSGRIEVITIAIAGVPAVVANFEFEWYAGSISPANLILDGAMIPITTPNLENQLPGKYFVIARDLNTQCESLAKEVNILPDNIILPTVVIVENQPQSSCDVATPNGILSATVDGGNDDTNPNYLFTWYSGPVVNIANLIPNGNASILQNAAEGEYTVDVLNLITGCSMTSTFFVEDASELLRLQISATVIPVTLCTSDNGVLEVRVTNHPDLGNWQFDWTGPGGFVASGPIINNVSPGTYTVSAIDITGNFCPSVSAEAIITDERIIPPITIIEDNPLTNCDITKVNGQLSASVDGKVGGYDFEWYNGPTATGPIMHQANIYSQLDIGTYTVQVIDQLTQCANTASGDITDGTVTPPSPTATVLNNLNDCINPDGEVTADVNGSTLGYSFNWYDGSTVGSSPDETTPGYTDLDLGDYTVTATDLQTGCISGPATVPITDERIYPEFEYDIVASNCQVSNGAIELVFLDAFDVQEVTWFDDSGVEVDRATNLYNYPPGDYEVTVATFFGCETDGQVSIPTEITNYNGISANGDGLNDDFQIDCINLFPNNIVKIFNRSGLLVYQGNNYDNINIVFDGRGENGLYLIGENLPDGTYFYIIDKGDGSRPVTGYLELMR